MWPARHIPPGKSPVCFDDLQMHNSVSLRTVVEQDFTRATLRGGFHGPDAGCVVVTFASLKSIKRPRSDACGGSGKGGHGDRYPHERRNLAPQKLEKKSRTITGNFTHKRYDRLETKGYIKRSSQSPSMQNMLYEITAAGKAALRAAGGAAG